MLTRFLCCECGAPAKQLTVPRKSKPFQHWLGVAIAYPLRQNLGLFVLTAFVLGLIPFLTQLIASSPGQLDGVAHAVSGGVITLYALILIDSAARGGPGETGQPLRLLRAVVATAIVWVPGLVYLLLIGPPRAPQRDVFMWLYGMLGAVYIPIVLAIVATNASFADVLNPFRVFDLAWNLGRTYVGWLIAVLALAGGTAMVGTSVVANLRHSVTAPLIGEILAIAPVLVGVTMAAAMLGLVTFVHGDVFGWGDASEFHDPLFPHLKPEGVRKAVASAQAANDGDPANRTGTGGMSPAERADAARLADALKSENPVRALRIYEARTDWSAAAVDDRKLVQIANAAARAKKPELAAQLLEKAYAHGGRAAAQALLALAQLKVEVQAKPDEVQAIYRKIVEKHAGTEAARVAAKRLAP